jgi:hypothetical protein
MMRVVSPNATRPPALPREHGAWVMLILPLVLGGAFVFPNPPVPNAGWLFPPTAVAVFLAHYALVPVIQRRLSRKTAPDDWRRRRLLWGGVYLAVAALLFVLTVVWTAGPTRAPFVRLSVVAAVGGALYFVAACTGTGRLVVTELVGMASMSLAAPLMALAAGTPIGPRPLGASVLAFVYSASALSYVRAYGSGRSSRWRTLRTAGGWHLLLFALVAWVARDGWLPDAWPAVFLPPLVRLLSGVALPPRNLRALGLREIWVALSYAAIAIALVAV